MKKSTTHFITKFELQNIKIILNEACEDDYEDDDGYVDLHHLGFLKATIEDLENGKEIDENNIFKFCQDAIPELLNYKISKLYEKAKVLVDMRNDIRDIFDGTIKLEESGSK